MNSALLVDEKVRSGIPEVDNYIELLESVVVAYTSDNATRMVAEANRVIGILADDLSLIAEDGSVKGTKLIKEEKNNMAMDRIVKLMQQVAAITNISRSSVNIGKEIAYKIPANNKIDSKTDNKSEIDSKTDNNIEQISDIQREKDNDMLTSSEPLIEQLILQAKKQK